MFRQSMCVILSIFVVPLSLQTRILLQFMPVRLVPCHEEISKGTLLCGCRLAPMHAIHIVGRCLRLISVYAAYHYVIGRGVSLTFFVFVCLLGSAVVFSTIQRPWRGRPLPNNVVLETSSIFCFIF